MKYALITGANSGLGLSAVKELSKSEWIVLAADINTDVLEKIKNESIIPIKMDVTNMKSIEEAYNVISKETDSLNAIINFAGILAMDSLIEADITQIEKIVDVNLMGMIRVNKVFFPMINNIKGRIINISSETGWMSPAPFNGPYVISKYGVEAYNDSLRRELNFLGIKVIKLQLGSFKTKMHDSTKSTFDEFKNKTEYYSEPLSNMGKSMRRELKHAHSHKYMLNALHHALYDENPKINYRVKNSLPMIVISSLPEKWIDNIYLKSLKNK